MTTVDRAEPTILRPLLGIGATILILAGMWAGASVVNLVLLAGLLTLLCVPLLHWLRARGIASWLAITLIFLGVFVGAALILILLGVSAAQVVANISEYEQAVESESDELTQALQASGVDASAFASTLKSVASWLFSRFWSGEPIRAQMRPAGVNSAFLSAPERMRLTRSCQLRISSLK